MVFVDTPATTLSPAAGKPMLEEPPPRWAVGILSVGEAVPFLA
jgi:hypothetical protein